MRIGDLCVACRGPVSAVPEQPANQRQCLARHGRLAGDRGSKVTRAEPAELRIRANRPVTVRESADTPAFGVARIQGRVWFTVTGQRLSGRSRSFAERHCERAGLRVGEIDSFLADVAPARVEDVATAASGER